MRRLLSLLATAARFAGLAAVDLTSASPAGALHSIATFTGAGIGAPNDITTGPDGNLWFTLTANHRIGRMTTAGSLATFGSAPTVQFPEGIAVGADENIWFASSGNGRHSSRSPSSWWFCGIRHWRIRTSLPGPPLIAAGGELFLRVHAEADGPDPPAGAPPEPARRRRAGPASGRPGGG